jgi:hypothetical protein
MAKAKGTGLRAGVAAHGNHRGLDLRRKRSISSVSHREWMPFCP